LLFSTQPELLITYKMQKAGVPLLYEDEPYALCYFIYASFLSIPDLSKVATGSWTACITRFKTNLILLEAFLIVIGFSTL